MEECIGKSVNFRWGSLLTSYGKRNRKNSLKVTEDSFKGEWQGINYSADLQLNLLTFRNFSCRFVKALLIMSHSFWAIFSFFQEGFTKLWTGLGPNVARNAIINAAELASYDQVKQVDIFLFCMLLGFLPSFCKFT